ncbi:PAS domain-containing protein [Thermoactinomyces mirandus]|uniref:PAS domain-containing protein n=1 Tax=Thermoactinomyces mirandus TaxID=2756294 RepID=A0A7W1XSJ0_9BACL|nr:PAS domain-containing protein [Thermoactinomyces mirandus]
MNRFDHANRLRTQSRNENLLKSSAVFLKNRNKEVIGALCIVL